MILTRTPFRVSFAGGGTDLPIFYKKNKFGKVISSTIKKRLKEIPPTELSKVSQSKTPQLILAQVWYISTNTKC